MTEKQLQALEVLKDLTLEEISKKYSEINNKKHLPIKSQLLFWIASDGKVHSSHYSDLPIHNNGIKTLPNYYSEHEATKELEYLTARMRIINRIRELNNGYVPNFEDQNEIKYYAYYGHDVNKIDILFNTKVQILPLNMYLKTRKLAEQLIVQLEQDLLTYFKYENWNWLKVNEGENQNG